MLQLGQWNGKEKRDYRCICRGQVGSQVSHEAMGWVQGVMGITENNTTSKHYNSGPVGTCANPTISMDIQWQDWTQC